MRGDDKHYFYKRAETEMLMAQKATCAEAELAHRGLAKRYIARIEATENPLPAADVLHFGARR